MNAKAVSVAAVLLIAWLVTTHPSASGHFVHGIGSFAASAVDGLKTFASSLRRT